MLKRVHILLILSLQVLLSLNVYAQTSNVQNLSINTVSGLGFISDDQVTELDNIINTFENDNKSIDVIVVMRYHNSQTDAEDYIKTCMDEKINPLVLYINPYGSHDWNSNVFIKTTSDVAGMVSGAHHLERIRKTIMIKALDEKEVTYYHKVFGQKKETFSSSLKYYMAVKLALSEFDHLINPPPIELSGIEINGKIYMNNEDCFVERTSPPVSFKAVELFSRGLPEYDLNWTSIAENNSNTSYYLLTEKGENSIKFNSHMASFYSYVNASYGNKTVKVGVYSVSFDVNKDKDWVIPGRMDSISFYPSCNIENTLEDFRYEVITEGPVSNHKTYYVDTKAIEWYPAVQNDFGEAVSWYPSGEYKVKIRLVGPKGLSIEKVHRITILKKYDLKNIEVIDSKAITRKATENDTLYIVGPPNRDVNLKVYSTDPTKKFWPEEPKWLISYQNTSSNLLNGSSINYIVRDYQTYKAKALGYDEEKEVFVKMIPTNRRSISYFPVDVGNSIRRFASSMEKLNDIMSTINRFNPSSSSNLRFRTEFSSNITGYTYYSDNKFNRFYHTVEGGKVDFNFSLAGSFRVPLGSYPFLFFTLEYGLFVEAKVGAKGEVNVMENKDPSIPKDQWRTVIPGVGLTGEVGGGIYGEARAGNYVAAAKGQFKVPMSMELKYKPREMVVEGIVTIRPVVLVFSLEVKEETKTDSGQRTPQLDYVFFKASYEMDLLDPYVFSEPIMTFK